MTNREITFIVGESLLLWNKGGLTAVQMHSFRATFLPSLWCPLTILIWGSSILYFRLCFGIANVTNVPVYKYVFKCMFA